MIEVEDEPSESWAELTQVDDEEGDDSQSDKNAMINARLQRLAASVPVPAEEDKKCPDIARRYQGVSTSKFEDEYPSLAESARFRQKARDFDLRRLNRDSRDSRDHGDNGLWKRDHRRGGHRDNIPWSRDHSRESYDDSSPNSYRPRNPHRSDETSPFRSPLNRGKRSGYRDLDNSNSNNFRFSNNRRRGGRSSGGNRGNGNERDFPVRDENTKFSNNRRRGGRSSGGNRIHDFERDFPVRDENKSCRRLYLPSQDDDLDDDLDEKEMNEIFMMVTEESEIKMARREKDIAYGKNTDDYKQYVQIVPKYKRREGRDPHTPDKFANCSRRSWDGQVKHWKLKLHQWAANYNKKYSRGSQKSSNSEGTTLTSECSSVKEKDSNLVIVEDSIELPDGEGEQKVADKNQEDENVEFVDEVAEENENGGGAAKESKDDDDDDFLGAIDYSSLVGN